MHERYKGVISKEKLYQVHSDESVWIGNLKVTPFRMSHDAAEPVCYTVESAGQKLGMATDLGMFDDYIIEHLAGSDILLLEANHDISMLEAGKYPYHLKCRILSSRGHLSNEASGRLCAVCRETGCAMHFWRTYQRKIIIRNWHMRQ